MAMRTIGLDIGTTTIGYAVVDWDAMAVLEAGSNAHRASLDHGGARQDAEKLLRLSTQRLEALERRWGAAAIGISGQMHGIVYIDSAGDACSPLYTWLYDGARRYSEEIAARAGQPIPVGYGLATHYANTKENITPRNAAGLATIMDYVVMKILGARTAITDATCADSLGLFAIDKGDFDLQSVEALGIDRSWLPTISPAAAGVSRRGITVAAPIGDNQAGYIGALSMIAADNSDRQAMPHNKRPAWDKAAAFDTALLINIGTSAQISQSSGQYRKIADGGVEWRPLMGDQYLATGSVLSGGKSLELLARFFADVYSLYAGKPPDDIYSGIGDFQRAHREFTPERPLVVDTRFLGTRDNPERRGAIESIGADNWKAGELIYGVMSGIVDELYALWRQCNLPAPQRLIGSGTALQANRLLRQLASERWGMPLRLASHGEAAALGAATVAMMAAERPA